MKFLRSEILSKLASLFSILSLYGCSEEAIPVVNEADWYSECNSRLIACSGSQIGEYCLFGYKWGEDQNFEETGIEVVGPQTSGGTLLFPSKKRMAL